MSPKWKDNQPLTALTGRCLSEKVSLPLLHHRLFRMAELYPRPFHFVKKKFFGHHLRRQPRPFFKICGEAVTTTLGPKGRQT